MKTLRAFALALALPFGALAITAPAPAQQNSPSPEAVQAAKDLVTLVSANTVWDMATRMTAETWPNLEVAIRSRNPNVTPEVIGELRHEFERIQYDYMSHFLTAMPQLYARHFSADELRDLLTFYRSRTGMKALQTAPYLAAEFLTIVQPHLPTAQENVQQAFTDILRQRGFVR
jgi:hypothetical protein